MLNLALHGLETAINQYLRLDPDTMERIADLSGKLIEIEITDWHITLFVSPTKDGFHLSMEPTKQPDTQIKGKLFALVRVGLQGATSRSLFENQIHITGDTEAGQKFRNILQSIDIDWEEHLSKLTGDSIAHKLSFHLNQIVSFGKDTLGKIANNVKEYVHYEVQYFPTADQIETFYRDISQLRNDVDRLAARIERLQENKGKEKND